MNSLVEQYKLGDVSVRVIESERPNKYTVQCSNEAFKSEFTVSEYEFKNYRRLMNQRITETFKEAKEEGGNE
mgnify:CR=1 FL=1|jgi:hypothetical protein